MMEICLSRWRFRVLDGADCLSKIPYFCFSLGMLIKGGSYMRS